MGLHKSESLTTQEREILRRVVEHWKQGFTGTSALELAEFFVMPHEEVIRMLEVLANSAKIHLRRARLGQPTNFREGKTDGEARIKVPEEWKIVDTLVAFPERDMLKEIFDNEGKDYGVFTNRLRRGASQLQHYYFKQDILDKYLKRPEHYRIWDDVVGGNILTKDDYYFSFPDDKRGDETFARIRYGKRKLKNGSIAVVAIAKDLSDLPYKEQQNWASFEIDYPEFVREDEEFEKYWRESFEASFIEHEDPLQQIYETFENINRLIGVKLFQNDSENPYLWYPVVNANWAYQNAHKELFKLFGPDSLVQDVLLDLLKNRLGVREEDLKCDVRRYKGKWALFKMLIGKIPRATFEPLQRCYNARQEDAHRIAGEVYIPSADLTEKFRNDCLEILETLKLIELHLKSILK